MIRHVYCSAYSEHFQTTNSSFQGLDALLDENANPLQVLSLDKANAELAIRGRLVLDTDIPRRPASGVRGMMPT